MSAAGRWRAELVLALAIVLSYLLVWPVGEYAIDDDWAYARSLFYFHDAGVLRILDWNPMSLVAHVFWGAIFTKVFGFSFTVAKISTVVLLWLEGAATIALLRRVGASEATAAVCALALLFNPLHFFQGFLYATDVPAVAWSTVALALYARGLTGNGSGRWLWLGSLAASLAWGVRQSGILVVAAVFVYLAAFDRPRLRSVEVWLRCFSLPALAVVAFTVWYRFIHGPTHAYLGSKGAILRTLSQTTAAGALESVYTLVAYLAFFLLPLILASPPAAYRPGRRRWLAAGLGGLVLAAFLWVTFGRDQLFPYLRNKITRFGYLSPNELVLGDRDVLWSDGVAWGTSLLLALAGVALVLRGSRAWSREAGEEPARRATRRLVGVFLAVQLVYVAATLGIVFDRHLLILLPSAVVLFVARPIGLGPRPRIAAACLVPLAFYSVAGTHDVHAFSRAAFRAGLDLVGRGVDPQQIDAGYAFDGWFMYERSWWEVARRRQPGLARAGDMWYLTSGLIPRIRTRYVISLSPTLAYERWSGDVAPWARDAALAPRLDRYRIVDELEYRNWWPWEMKKLFVLEDATLRPPNAEKGR